MIIKRARESDTETTNEHPEATVLELNPSLRKEFRNWQEEALYVINVLKEQGTDIYAAERSGGMYLNRKNKVPTVFEKSKDKKEQTTQTVNTTNKESLNNFFKK